MIGAKRAPVSLLARLGGPRRGQEAPQPALELLPIVFSYRIVGYGSGHLVDPHFEPSPALRRVETTSLGLTRPQNLRQRTRGREHFRDGGRPARACEVIGVLPFRQTREQQALARRELGQSEIDRPVGGASSGRVAIKTEHRL